MGAVMGADGADASAAQVGPGERERELEDSVALLKATLESTADGIIVTDCSGKVVLLNQRFKSLWHLSDDVAVQDVEHGELPNDDALLGRHLTASPIVAASFARADHRLLPKRSAQVISVEGIGRTVLGNDEHDIVNRS